MPKALINTKIVRDAVCPDGKARLEYFDTKVLGFVLEVRASGGKTFYVRYRDQRSVQRQFKIGSTDHMSVDDARKQAQKLLGRIAMGDDPRAERAILRQVPTLETFVADSYMPHAKAHKRSWRADDSYLRNHILPRFGSKPLDLITKREIVEWHNINRMSHLAVATTNRLLILLRYIFNLAITWETPGVVKNPAADIPLFEVDNRRERFLTKTEAVQLCDTLLKSRSAMLRFIVPMLIMTGARKHEVLEARWEDFDFGRQSWRIPLCKAGKARHVPLSEGVLRLLETVPRFDRCPFVFPNPETGQPYQNIGAWYRIRKMAGLSDVRMHDLRHSFASFLVNSGRSLYEVQQLLGHSTSRMTQRYAHLSQETLLNAANAAAEAAGIGALPALSSTPPLLRLPSRTHQTFSPAA